MGNSVVVRDEHLSLIAFKQRQYNLTQERWAESAWVSLSTLKRFLKGIPVGIDNVKSICKVIKIDNWQDYTNCNDKDSTRVTSYKDVSEIIAGETSGVEKLEKKNTGTVIVSGNFDDNKKTVIGLIVKKLDSIFVDFSHEIDNSSILISGDFTENCEQKARAFVKHLEAILLEPDVTIVEY